MVTVDINTLPTEILQKCFRKIIDDYEANLKDLFNGNLIEMERASASRDERRSDLPNARFLPISRTCKYWRNAAEPVLYSSITTRSHIKQLQTALGSARRWNLVRKLRIIPLPSLTSRSLGEDEVKCIISIIRSCPEIIHLELSGFVCDRFLTDDLFSAMRKPSLAHIYFNVDCEKMPTNIMLRNMSLYWPNIERIVFVRSDKRKEILTKGDMDKFAKSKSLTRLRCIRLSTSLSYQQMNALSFLTSASPLEYMELALTPDSTVLPVLHKCIDHWTPTLRHFVLYLGREGWETLPNVSMMIANLRDLITLDCDSNYQILPENMIHLTKLEKLIYKVDRLDILKALTETIASGLLPSLNSIDVNAEISGYTEGPYKEAEASFQRACEARAFKHHLINNFFALQQDLLADFFRDLLGRNLAR